MKNIRNLLLCFLLLITAIPPVIGEIVLEEDRTTIKYHTDLLPDWLHLCSICNVWICLWRICFRTCSSSMLRSVMRSTSFRKASLQ